MRMQFFCRKLVSIYVLNVRAYFVRCHKLCFGYNDQKKQSHDVSIIPFVLVIGIGQFFL